MVHAFKLYTERDNTSHVVEGTVALAQRTDVVAVHFQESPPHSALDWHDAPEQNTSSRSQGLWNSRRAMARPSFCVRATCWLRPMTAGAGTSGG
jgi:hypothetical protein